MENNCIDDIKFAKTFVRIVCSRNGGLAKHSEGVTVTKNEWKTIGVRIKAKDLPLFNRRLSLY